MGARVLLIEDEPNIREAIRFILARAGFDVAVHPDGRDVTEAVTRGRPDVVILDVMLPHRSGFDVLRDLRARRDLRDLPVLMLTARGQARDREMAARLGATRFMTKPFDNAEVLEAVRALAASRGGRREG